MTWSGAARSEGPNLSAFRSEDSSGPGPNLSASCSEDSLSPGEPGPEERAGPGSDVRSRVIGQRLGKWAQSLGGA